MSDWGSKEIWLWVDPSDFLFGAGATLAPASGVTSASGVRAPDRVMGESRWETQWTTEAAFRGKFLLVA